MSEMQRLVNENQSLKDELKYIKKHYHEKLSELEEISRKTAEKMKYNREMLAKIQEIQETKKGDNSMTDSNNKTSQSREFNIRFTTDDGNDIFVTGFTNKRTHLKIEQRKPEPNKERVTVLEITETIPLKSKPSQIDIKAHEVDEITQL